MIPSVKTSLISGLAVVLLAAGGQVALSQSTVPSQTPPHPRAPAPTQPAADPQSAALFASPARFTYQDGADIYRYVCAGCHMPGGRGAVGAGAYPALANNAKLEASGYPVYLVVNGQKAMPAFGSQLNDAQVAAVVNYIRSNFGNSYTDQVTAEDVKAVRQ